MNTSTTVSKAVNYTEEQAAEMASLYAAGTGVSTEELATKYGKTVKSIVAKLSRMGVYVKKEYKTKTGEVVVKKDEHATAIGAILRMTENDTSSLAKANKTALAMIFKALSESVSTEED